WVSSDHERESAALGARFRTGAGYVQVMDALLRQGRSDFTALTWGYSAGVGDHGSGLGAFHDAVLAEDDFFGHLGVADAQKDAVGCGANLLGSLAEVTFFGFGYFLRLVGGVRPERYLMRGAQYVAGHGITLDAQS